MKKIIIVLVLVVLVVLVATPFVSGVIMERTVYRSVEDFNTMFADYPLGYSYEIDSYSRGYSNTDFELKINTGAMKSIYSIDSIIITAHARHGYSGVVSTMSLEENVWFNEFINNKLQGENPFHIQTCFSFLGEIESTVAWDSFSIMVEEETLDVKGGEIITSMNRELDSFSSSGCFEGMAIGDTLSIGEMSIASSVEKITAIIWDGEMAFEVKDIKMSDKDGEVKLKDLAVVYGVETEKDADTMSYSTFLTLDSLQANNQNFSDGSIRFSVSGINMEVYEEFMNTYLRVYSQMMSKISIDEMVNQQNEEVVKKEMKQVQLQMMGVYEKFLKKGLEIRVSDLHFKHTTGEAGGEVTLRLLKDMTFMQFAPVLFQPRALLDIFHLESDVRFPAQLAGENPKLLTPLFPGMQTGVFVKNEDMLSHSAETKDGALFLNGKEINLGG